MFHWDRTGKKEEKLRPPVKGENPSTVYPGFRKSAKGLKGIDTGIPAGGSMEGVEA